MKPSAESAAPPADREIVITRVFAAPRELVWSAWTDPQQVARWWGPRGFTTTIEKMDVRPGGEWIHVMRGPDGTNYPNHSRFIEVVKPERIVYTHGGHREGGSGVSFRSTWTFEELADDQTRLTIRMVFDSAEQRNFVAKEFGAIEGGKQTLERLGEFLSNHPDGPSSGEVTLIRQFAAPPALVFKLWTDADHLARWWGPAQFTNPVCQADARPGGKWHIVMRGPEGSEYPCGGTYREVVPGKRLVFTNDAITPEGTVILRGFTTVTFEEENGGTKLTLRTRATALAPLARAHLQGMEAGWTQSIDRLAREVAHAAR